MRTFQDAVNIHRALTIVLSKVCAIRDQPADSNMAAVLIHDGDTLESGKLRDPAAQTNQQKIILDENSVTAFARLECALDVVRRLYLNCQNVSTDARRCIYHIRTQGRD